MNGIKNVGLTYISESLCECNVNLIFMWYTLSASKVLVKYQHLEGMLSPAIDEIKAWAS